LSTNKYINMIKDMIEKKATVRAQTKSPDQEFFNNLFPEIKYDIRNIEHHLPYPIVDDATLESYFEVSRKEYLSVNPIDIERASSLTKEGFKTWLTAERSENIEWNYTDRYIQYLEASGRSKIVVNETKTSSLDIMGKIGDPKSSEGFYAKGLVVGEVQSGKTGNFNAVINRSIDCGYGLIIVLSGIMEDLRSQTQQRIESDVIGEGVIDIEKERTGKKGVGKIKGFGPSGDSDVDQVVSITSHKSDFNTNLLAADFSLNHINVLVCKKNHSVLRNLIVWLHDYLEQETDKHNIPLLILDDEADNASLNNEGAKGREYASKINGHIRALLFMFHKKTYLGYTATPFANVLQDRNADSESKWSVPYKLKGEYKEKKLPQVSNIFPDDFIVLLGPPSNYIGAKQIFETVRPIDNRNEEKIPLVHVVDDHVENFPSRVYDDPVGDTIGVENFSNKNAWDEIVGEFGTYLDFGSYNEYRRQTRASTKNDDFPIELPSSLKDAILCFVLSIAVRESRKANMINSALYQPHNTMLIHNSRFTLWQNKTRKFVDTYVKKIKSSINNDNPSSKSSIYFEIENIWYRYYAKIIETIGDYLPIGYVDDFMTPIVFESLKNYLPEAVKDLEVKAINSVTKEKLEYPKEVPKKIIAIGGNRLSRGFTLEGLSINYFVRATNYSDTLFQMGRWFGYRPGYLDCCKIFTTQDSLNKFNLTTRCVEELEVEFRKMDEQNKSPENFVLRVKKHPGVLKITRPSILKNTIDVKWSYQDQLEMTTTFDIHKEKIERVWVNFKDNLAPLFNQEVKKENPEGFFIYRTTANGIIDILKQENNIQQDELRQIIMFIELCQSKNKLKDWTVAVKTTGQASTNKGKGILKPDESGLPDNVQLVVRRGPSSEVDKNTFLKSYIFKATGRSANIVSSSKDLSLLLSDTEISKAEKEFIDKRKQHFLLKDKTLSESDAEEKAKKVNIPERVYRERMKETEGLLIIYLFDSYYSFRQEKGSEDRDLEFKSLVEKGGYNLEIPIIGYALGFPPIKDDPGGEYVQGDYDLELDEDMPDEVSDMDDLTLPDDVAEQVL